MNCKFYVWLLMVCSAMSIGLCTAQEVKTKSSFPKTVSFAFQGKTYTLALTGISTRESWFTNVYKIASYIENPDTLKGYDVMSNILDSKNAKQLTIRWLKDMKENDVQEEYRDALGRVTGNAAQIVTFADIFGAVKNGDTHTIRWMPNGTITVDINGRETGKMQNQQFAKELWSIWFGRDSVVDREELVSQIRNTQ